MSIPAFTVVAGLALAGEYSAALDVDVSTLITRERTLSEHAVTAITLSLRPDGAADAKVWSELERRRSASKYAPGGPSKSREQTRDQATFAGSWSAEGDAWKVDLRSTTPAHEPLTLLCHTGTTEAGPALGCELLLAPDWLFVPGQGEQNGSRGWLLLGPNPGLWVRTRQGFHDREPSVTLKKAEHSASEVDLTGSWRSR